MNTFPHLPSQFRWSAQQLADAVPLRLLPPTICRVIGRPIAANDPPRRRRVIGYLPASAPLSAFRIH